MNGASLPSGAVIFKRFKGTDIGMSLQLSESSTATINDDLNQRFYWFNNAGKAMLLEGDFDWKEMGLNNKRYGFSLN